MSHEQSALRVPEPSPRPVSAVGAGGLTAAVGTGAGALREEGQVGAPGPGNGPTELETSERMAMLGRLSGVMSHDLNNLITAISGYATLLADAMPSKSPMRQDVDGVLAATRRCAELVAQFQQVSREGDGQLRKLDLGALLSERHELLDRVVNGTARFACRVPSGETFPVRVDPIGMEHVLLQLVVEAREALSDGQGTGSIEIGLCVSSLEEGDGQARAAGAGGGGQQVVLQVAHDPGEGAGESVRKLSPSGVSASTTSGRGLVGVGRLVSRWGGTMVVTDRSVRLKLPLARD